MLSKGYIRGEAWAQKPKHSSSEGYKNVRNRVESLTSWRELPKIRYCRDVIKSTIARIFGSYNQFEQEHQTPDNIATILEHYLFIAAASEKEYINRETLIHRLHTHLDKVHGPKYSQQESSTASISKMGPSSDHEFLHAMHNGNLVEPSSQKLAGSIIDCMDGFTEAANSKLSSSNGGLFQPSNIHGTVFSPYDLSSFTTRTDMDLSSNYPLCGGVSNLKTSSKSRSSQFQQQHADYDMIKNTDCLGPNQKDESMAFLSTMGNSLPNESLNSLIPQNVSGEISQVCNIFPRMSSSFQSAVPAGLWQDQSMKLDFLPNMKCLEHWGGNHGSFGDIEGMQPPLKRQKMDLEVVQPCLNGRISYLHQHLQSPLSIYSENSEESPFMSINGTKNNVIDDKGGTNLSKGFETCHISKVSHPKSHHVILSSNLKEDVGRLNSSTHTVYNDLRADIEDLKSRTELNQAGENVTNEVIEQKPQLEKETKSSNPTINVSLTEFLACDSRADIEDLKGITEFIRYGENVTNEVIETKAELEKETKSLKPTTNIVSLSEFLTCDQIREHIMSFRQQLGQCITKDEEERELYDKSCQLCKMGKLSFTPLPIYCLSCGIRIKKDANYYCKRSEELDIENCFCSTCYRRHISSNGKSISKEFLDRKSNYVLEEPWVQCDKCKAWQHEICALFINKGDLEGNAEYMCPICCLKEIEDGTHVVPSPKATTFGAKDLPRTMLSEHIEERLFKRLAQERVDKAKIERKNLDEVLAAENMCVRVVSSVNKQLKVDKQFLNIFSSENYPDEFSYESKVIFLFQNIEGVDVVLFAMYVQEFGSECGYSNQRCVYISYLDSVKYLRPQRETVTGEALRTFVYQEILIGYLDYCKKRGFATCYIWSCPPVKGDDYILYCHPKTQKTPKNDKLRLWYHSMLKKAAEENIVVGFTNIYDHFFDPNGKCESKLTATRLPYFDGDYWSCAAVNLLRKIEETEEKGARKVKKRVRKRTSKAMEHTNPLEGTSKDVLVMKELGENILPFKEDFMIVHLQHTCMQCHEVIMSGKRWFCSECKNFQECERCHTTDTHIANSEEKHTLSQVLVHDIPFDTKDNDITLDNELLETRHKFLAFCQKNHLQFDTLRHAKHSSSMILHHFKCIFGL